MWWKGAVLFFTVGLAVGQQIASDCPAPDGYFADAVQCDLYYECIDGVISEKVCPDGFVFNDLNPRLEKCDFPFQVSCEGRPELQIAQPTENCPRQNGYFPHPDPSNCREFFYCTAGIGSKITCPEGLTFSIITGTCVWPDESGRTGCSAEKVVNFTCPEEPISVAVAHPRYADPTDCQYFYVCINGATPRRSGCAFGQVFNPEIGACDSPKEVVQCNDYYIDYFREYFETLGGEGGSHIAGPDIIAAAIASGFEVPKNIVRLDPDVKIQRRRPAGGSRGPAKQEAPEPAVPRRQTPAAPRRQTPAAPRRPETQPAAEQPARRRPTPLRRQRPATTTTPPPPAADDYYYYDYADVPEGAADPATGGV